MLFVLPQAFVCISSSKESKACSSDAWNRNPHERQRDVDSKRLAQHCILRPVLGTEAQLLQDDLLFMDVQIVGASRSTMDGFFTSRAQKHNLRPPHMAFSAEARTKKLDRAARLQRGASATLITVELMF